MNAPSMGLLASKKCSFLPELIILKKREAIFLWLDVSRSKEKQTK